MCTMLTLPASKRVEERVPLIGFTNADGLNFDRNPAARRAVITDEPCAVRHNLANRPEL